VLFHTLLPCELFHLGKQFSFRNAMQRVLDSGECQMCQS
jgi:hypothetical protein